MKKLILLLLAINLAFGMELWKQRHYLDKQLFQEQFSLIRGEAYPKENFDFFKDMAQKLNVTKELEVVENANNLEEFLKAKAKFIAKMESNAFDTKSFDLIDMLDAQENIEKEALFSKKIKKLFVSLEKSNLKMSRKPLEELFLIKEYFAVLGKSTDHRLLTQLEESIKEKNSKKFNETLKRLESEVLLLKSEKLLQKALEKNIKQFLRYNKLTAFDYSNGVDDAAAIKNTLEYTEAVIFSSRAKGRILAVSGNLKQNDFKKLLDIYKKIIINIQSKKNKKEVRSLTKEAKKVVLAATGLKELKETPKEIISHVNDSLASMLKMVKQGNFKQADFFRLEAYSFFDPDIEARLRPRNPALTTELEGLFWDGYNGKKGLGYSISHKDKNAVSTTVKQLKSKLLVAKKELESKLSYGNSMVQSMMIIVREGLEAVLVLAVLLTLFTSKRDKIYLFVGVVLGFLASIGTYYAAKELLTISTSNRELIEGGSALLAALMLIFVTAWIFHNTYVKGWVAYAKELTDKSVKSGSVLTLLFIGFLVVYREGFETVLFYEALAQDSYPQAVWIGFLVGLVIIVIVAILLVKGIKNLPIHLFFSVTGVLLSLLAVIFTGAGIRGLQTANILSASPSPYLKNWQFLRDYFGYSPTIETTSAQIVVALILLSFYLYGKYKNQKRNKMPMS